MWLKELKKAVKKTRFTLKHGKGWLNFTTPKGVSCEFYTCVANPTEQQFVTAHYKINGVSKDWDFSLPEQQDEFLNAVKQILKGY